jgi:hypothetical protein
LSLVKKSMSIYQSKVRSIVYGLLQGTPKIGSRIKLQITEVTYYKKGTAVSRESY